MKHFTLGNMLVPATTDEELAADCVACMNCVAFAWAARGMTLPAKVAVVALPSLESVKRGIDHDFAGLEPKLAALLEMLRSALKSQNIALPDIEKESLLRLRYLAGFGLCLASPPTKAYPRASHPLTHKSWRCNSFVKRGTLVVTESAAPSNG